MTGRKLLPRQHIETVEYSLLIGKLTTLFPGSLSSASAGEEKRENQGTRLMP